MSHVLFIGFRGNLFQVQAALDAGFAVSLLIQAERYKESYEDIFTHVFVVESLFDQKSVLEVVADKKFDGILTRLEEYTQLVSIVGDSLGITTTSRKDSRVFRDKFEMKKRLQEHGVACADGIIINSLSDAQQFLKDHSFPLILKQLGGMSSRFVVEVDSEQELETCLKDFKRQLPEKASKLHVTFSDSEEETISKRATNMFLLETKMTGIEVTVDSFVTAEGFFHTPLCKYMLAEEFGLEDKHLPIRTLPFTELKPEFETKILTVVESALRALGAINCTTHTELFVDPTTEKIEVIEIASRGGGLRGEMIEAATTIPYTLNTFLTATGKLPSIDYSITGATAGVKLFADKTGTLKSINTHLITEHTNCIYFRQRAEIGEVVQPSTEGGAFICQFVIQETNFKTAEALAKDLLTSLRKSLIIE